MLARERIERVADSSRDELLAILHELERRGRQAFDLRFHLQRQWPVLAMASLGVAVATVLRRALRRRSRAPRWRRQRERAQLRSKIRRIAGELVGGKLAQSVALAVGELLAFELARRKLPEPTAPP